MIGAMTEARDFPADAIHFMPAPTGRERLDETDLPHSPGRLLQTETVCGVSGIERIYVSRIPCALRRIPPRCNVSRHHAFFTNSDLSCIAPIPVILQSML